MATVVTMFGAEEAHPLLEQGAALPPGRMPGVWPRAATPTGPRVRSRCHCWRWAGEHGEDNYVEEDGE